MRVPVAVTACLLMALSSAAADDDPNERPNSPAAPVLIESLSDALKHMFSYKIKGSDVIDHGRDAATAFLCRRLGDERLKSALRTLDPIGRETLKRYKKALGSSFDPKLLADVRARFSRASDSALRRFRFIDYVARLQSLEETARRMEWLHEHQPQAGKAYAKAILKLELILVPARIEFFLGIESAERDGPKTYHLADGSAVTKEAWEPSGWVVRNKSVLVSRYELSKTVPSRDALPAVMLDYKEFRELARKHVRAVGKGAVPWDLVDIPDEGTWEQLARGPHNRRWNVIGNTAHIKVGDLPVGLHQVKRRRQRLNDAFPLKDLQRRFPRGTSSYGAWAMMGNVSELVRCGDRGQSTSITGRDADARGLVYATKWLGDDSRTWRFTRKGTAFAAYVPLSKGGWQPPPDLKISANIGWRWMTMKFDQVRIDLKLSSRIAVLWPSSMSE